MPELITEKVPRQYTARHRGRSAQVGICLGKLLRMFIYQSDWKVLPMSALIAGLVGMVIRKLLFITMEGTLMGAFALVCVCIWNGCFNSIQVICRERDVIKREHRSGLHISSYVFAHMLYQLMLCVLQTGITLYVTRLIGVEYDGPGLFTPWRIVDLGISMLLITYASDMLSLFISTLARNTTTAMTIMPFVLIFQLVFSGGLLTLPTWTEHLTSFTISNPGLRVIAAQADTNSRPFVTISNMLVEMRDSEISAEVNLGQVLDILSDTENPTVAQIRGMETGGTVSGAQIREFLDNSAEAAAIRGEPVAGGITAGDVLDLLDKAGVWQELEGKSFEAYTTVGEIVDWLAASPDVQAQRDSSYAFTTTVGGVLDIVGEDTAVDFLEQRAAEASYKPEYECTRENIIGCWMHLAAFIVVFAMLSTIMLEFIDRDKR